MSSKSFTKENLDNYFVCGGVFLRMDMPVWSLAGLARLDSPKITFSPLQTAAKVTTICSTAALRFVRLKRDKHCAFFPQQPLLF